MDSEILLIGALVVGVGVLYYLSSSPKVLRSEAKPEAGFGFMST
jgi:hypothetical protein